MSSLAIAVGVELVEGARRDAGGHHGKHRPGEHVGHVELTGVTGVGQDHVAAEHRHRQPTLVVSFAQQHLGGPLAVVVAVGVAVIDGTRRVEHPHVGVFLVEGRHGEHGHADGRYVRVGLEFGGERDADQLGGANHVGAEQLAVGQYVVDQGRGVDDQVDGVGQPLPSLPIQPEVGLPLVTDDHLEVLTGQMPEVRQQRRIATVERSVKTPPRFLLGLGPHQANQLAADGCQPFQQFQGQEAPQEAGRAGEQHGAHLPARARQRRGGGERLLVDEIVQLDIPGVHLTDVTAVHGRERRPSHPGLPLGLDVVGDPLQIGRGADDDAHGHVDVENLVQKVGKRQRRQRVSTQVAEVRIGTHVAARRAQERGRGPADRLQHRPVGAVSAQLKQVVGLALGEVGIQLFEPLAVALLEFGPRHLADSGEQAVLER